MPIESKVNLPTREEVSSEQQSDSDPSSTTDPTHSTLEQPKKNIREDLAGQETRLVWRSKFIFLLSLIASAAAVSILTYCLAAEKEHNEFLDAYEDTAKEIYRSIQEKTKVEFGILYELSAAYTSWGLHSNESWPFVTLPNFERKVSTFLEMAGTEWVGFAPAVYFEDKEEWENYAWEKQGWIRDGWELIEGSNSTNGFDPIPLEIHEWEEPASDDEEDPFLAHVPFWQNFPTPDHSEELLLDLNTIEWFRHMVNSMRQDGTIELADKRNLDVFLHESIGESIDYENKHRVFMTFPVYSSFDDDADVAGFVFSSVPWESYFKNLLPETIYGIGIDIINSCGSKIYYTLNGPTVVKGITEEEHARVLINFADYIIEHPFTIIEHGDKGEADDFEECDYVIRIHPTSAFLNIYKTRDPLKYTMIIVAAFGFTIICFLLYDIFVARRQDKVMATAERTTAIVSSLFPEQVQERLMQEVNKEIQGEAANRKKKGFLGKASTDFEDQESDGARPIADLFPEVTLMFADIVGFTAWSSTREPAQVFTLLETVYASFDEIAKHRRVFKVETVGDCYVAACGLPTPRKDHMVVMARFARDCLHKVTSLFRELEVELGPDTADLGMRFGLHSGPVTAGVLRGDRARFQLFGDTMNVAARMEHLGETNKIHISEALMKLLTERGKSHWIAKRADKIVAKGKGEMQTYWLTFRGDSTAHSTTSGSSAASSESEVTVNHNNKSTNKIASRKVGKHSDMFVSEDRQERLVDWNTENLLKLLEGIAAQRIELNASEIDASEKKQLKNLEAKSTINEEPSSTRVFDEVKEIIELPAFRKKHKAVPLDSVGLHDDVRKQLRQYVQTIATMYRDNPFHNFEHASHVTMSVIKLLARIVAPADIASDDDEMRYAHDNTYGITSDPLTQFAVVFSALIHDVDHSGVPNAQLVKENSSMAALYKNRSVLEQNSVDLAWDLLMDETFTDLREAIYSTQEEFLRFRQLVVNTVMATDIMDKELAAIRRNRWTKAFDSEANEASSESTRDSINRKATIVIEHLIQASDVAHTMQHWHIYRKWNMRLFEELEGAYQEGRAEKSPAENWYKGEIGFFDFYIIPLAKKLKDCGVFGVSSDEYLNYAMSNREEWVQNGEAIVEELRHSMQFSKWEKNTIAQEKPPLIEGTPSQRTENAREA